MSTFVPENDALREALIFCFHLKKSSAELHRMLVELYGNHALSEATCQKKFGFNGSEMMIPERCDVPRAPKTW